MFNYFNKNKKFLMSLTVLAVAGFGVFAPLSPVRNLFLTGLTGFGMAGEAQLAFAKSFGGAKAVREYKASVKASGGDYANLSTMQDTFE